MSQIKVNSIVDAAGGSSAVLYGVASPPNSMGFRNRIINGDMRIDQRNAGASVTPSADGQYTLDRWAAQINPVSKFSVQQNAGAVTPPAGFSAYLGVTSTSAYTVGAGEFEVISQIVEGFNFSDLAWGTANAASVTLSFLVRSSLTGTFGGTFSNMAQNRSYPFTYTISAANTWEQKTITVAGDTTGTWPTTNAGCLRLRFGLGVGATYSGAAGSWSGNLYLSATGATSVVGTSGATFYITGIQLEAGSVASPFERRDYGRELQMCQRYYQRINTAEYINAYAYSTNRVLSGVPYTNAMRAAPTASVASNAFLFYTAATGFTSTAVMATPNASGFVALDVTVSATAGIGSAGSLTSALQLSSEL